MQVSTYDGRLYGVPLYADVSVLFWNKKLFAKAGLNPEIGPKSLQDIHDMAAKITALGDGTYGYYLAGNCAGCNIFTFGPLIWASGGTIEPKSATDEPLTGENLPKVLEWARMMHKEGLINPANRAENGETFHLQFGSGKVGIMGTGNFNLYLLKEQNPELFDGGTGITFLPGLAPDTAASFAGGDIVAIPKGSKRVDDAVDFMKFILSDGQQVESYARRHGGEQIFRREPAGAEDGDGPQRGTHALHAEVLRANQLAAGAVAANAAARLLHRRSD
jgi:multiple sugar transport system substrate-binding protein